MIIFIIFNLTRFNINKTQYNSGIINTDEPFLVLIATLLIQDLRTRKLITKCGINIYAIKHGVIIGKSGNDIKGLKKGHTNIHEI